MTREEMGSTSGRSPLFGRPAARPYAGGTGSTGSPASHDRREREDEHGVSAYRQEQVFGALRDAGSTGLTWSELGEIMSWHHGQSTGALSVLHKSGDIAALAERRKRSTVYVLKDFVLGRPTRDPGQTKGNTALAEANAVLNQENGALNQRILDLQVALAERDRDLAEARTLTDRMQDTIGRQGAELVRLEQQLALSVEQMGRLDDERAAAERALTLAKGDLNVLAERFESLERANHALRTRRALAQMEPEEIEMHRRVGTKLASAGIAEASDETPIRVTLGVLRTFWTLAGRLTPDALPQRVLPTDQSDRLLVEGAAPAAQEQDADPGQ